MVARGTSFAWIVVIIAFCPSLVLADEGAPSETTLQAMGLSGIQMMSDDDALSVRGMGAVAWGRSRASINGVPADANSSDGYFSIGRYGAAGGSHSYASKRTTRTTTVGVGPIPIIRTTTTRTLRVDAGGYSWALSL